MHSTYGFTPEKFRAELDSRGLKAVSGHFSYERCRDDIEGVAREAKILGEQYVCCAWIPHKDPFDGLQSLELFWSGYLIASKVARVV